MNCFGLIRPQDFGAVGDGVANDGPAFTLAAQAALAQGKGLFIPPGLTYRIASVVNCSGNVNQTLEIASSGATILCDTITTGVFSFNNVLRGHVRGLRFVGVAGRLLDCAHVIYGGSCLITVDDCEFTGVASSMGMVHAINGGLAVRNLFFRGAASQQALIQAGAPGAWGWCTVEDCRAADVGGPNPKIGPAAWQLCPVPAFLRVGDTVPLRGGFSQGRVEVRRCSIDENIMRAVEVVATLGEGKAPIYEVVLEDVKLSCSTTPANIQPGFDLQNIEHLYMRGCVALPFGGQGLQRDAISLRNVGRAEIEAFRCEADSVGVNRIYADENCGLVRLRGMAEGADYYELKSDAAVTEVLS